MSKADHRNLKGQNCTNAKIPKTRLAKRSLLGGLKPNKCLPKSMPEKHITDFTALGGTKTCDEQNVTPAIEIFKTLKMINRSN